MLEARWRDQDRKRRYVTVKGEASLRDVVLTHDDTGAEGGEKNAVAIATGQQEGQNWPTNSLGGLARGWRKVQTKVGSVSSRIGGSHREVDLEARPPRRADDDLEAGTVNRKTDASWTLSARGIEEDVVVVETRSIAHRLRGRPWRGSVDPLRAAVDTTIAGVAYLL